MKLNLRFLLTATGGCLLLTLLQLLSDVLTPSWRGYQRGFELLIVWIVVAAAWIIYLVSRVRQLRKDKKKEEPWNRKEKDP